MLFDKFWKETIAQTRAVPLDQTIEQLDEPVPYCVFRVTYKSFGGVRVTARLGVPAMVPPGTRLPAIVTAPGYSGRAHGTMLSEAQRGYLILQVDPRGMGESTDAFAGDTSREYLLRDDQSPATYFYRGVYMDVLRGIDYLNTRDDFDPTRVGALGASQGGGISLCITALEPQIRAVVAELPFLCNASSNTFLQAKHINQETFKYFDPLNFAPRIKVPALLNSGGCDTTCPPGTINAVFDRLAGVKALVHFPDSDHTSNHDFYRMGWEWIARYL
jgi:cephalosporin-C deacetylase